MYENTGIDMTVTAIAPVTADMTPPITAASADGSELYHVFGNDSSCTSALKAIKTYENGIHILVRCGRHFRVTTAKG